jgi:hypothetical protein
MHTQTIQPLPVILLAGLTGLFMTTWSHDREDALTRTYVATTDRRPAVPVRGASPQPGPPPVGQPPRRLLLRAAADRAAAAMIHSLAAASAGAGGLPAERRAGPAVMLQGAALVGESLPPRPLAARIASTWLLHTPAR